MRRSDTCPVVIGADIGTQGARAVAADAEGRLLGSRSRRFGLEGTREEQSPEEWWASLVACLRELAGDLAAAGKLQDVVAISVTSTSGTMIALDQDCRPVSPAFMYSDRRSAKEAEVCLQAARDEHDDAYKAYNSSSGLPKIVWFARRHPGFAERTRLWAHAADFIIGRLSGVWGVTDYSNSLKTGYDLIFERWPDYISKELGLPSRWFPAVVPPGTAVGSLSSETAELTGLPRTVKVVTGMTDGCTSQIASGALKPGDWNTTIGTTMVVKGVTRQLIRDPLGRLYNHKHPEGFWMPGGASNTGGDWVSRDYAAADLDRLNEEAARLTPTGAISYPLLQQGERFPFVSPQACGFDPEGLSAEQLFASRMEGVAFLERLSYEMITSLSGERIANIYTAGGASNSSVWLGIRSSVLGMPVRKAKYVEGAFGAAVLAASKTVFSGLGEAGEHMIQLESVTEPGSRDTVERYEEQYRQFLQMLEDRGYWKA